MRRCLTCLFLSWHTRRYSNSKLQAYCLFKCRFLTYSCLLAKLSDSLCFWLQVQVQGSPKKVELGKQAKRVRLFFCVYNKLLHLMRIFFRLELQYKCINLKAQARNEMNRRKMERLRKKDWLRKLLLYFKTNSFAFASKIACGYFFMSRWHGAGFIFTSPSLSKSRLGHKWVTIVATQTALVKIAIERTNFLLLLLFFLLFLLSFPFLFSAC